jgi:Uma2 family endonuclease
MATRAKTKLTVEQYLKKYEGAEGRFELVNGEVLRMAAETTRHVLAKGQAYTAFNKAVEKAKLKCHVLTDGVTIKIDKWTAREPDLSVQGSPITDLDSKLIDNPMIVVEVISPSSEFRDVHRKLFEYFSVKSIQHYVIVDMFKNRVLHNRRTGPESYMSSILGKGFIEFDPPGFRVAVSDLLKVN